jgi:hypothetical protein
VVVHHSSVRMLGLVEFDSLWTVLKEVVVDTWRSIEYVGGSLRALHSGTILAFPVSAADVLAPINATQPGADMTSTFEYNQDIRAI